MPAKRNPIGTGPEGRLHELSLRTALGGAALCWLLLSVALVASWKIPGPAGWTEAALVFTSTAATLLALARHLPGQNILLAAGLIALTGGAAHTLGVVTAVPFGPFAFGDNLGPRILGLLAWPMPALWVVALLSSRGVARMILRPWRRLRNYGYWLIGLTAALTVVFDAALEPFASRVQGYWQWRPTWIPVSWHGVPLINFLGWLLVSLLILALVTPVLINKLPRTLPCPPDGYPLGIWLGALALFAIGAASQGLWSATAFCALSGAGVGSLAIRGSRR